MIRNLLLPIVILSVFASAEPYDVIIRGGYIIDGTGAQRVRADLALRGGRIEKIASLGSNEKCKREINASGLVISPGFIDIHTHAERQLPKYPKARNYISQGVTTVVGGNCGGSPLPVCDYIDRVSSVGMGVNLTLLVGHNTIRRKVIGLENRAPTPEELEQMKALVREAMEEGAIGLSTGLKYIPGAYSTTEEVIELAKVAAEYGGFYATHMRDEGLGLIESVQEALTIAKEANISLNISHFKAVGKSMWGNSERILAMVDSARATGLDVTFDQYPYTATSTGLGVLFPVWALEGGRNEYVKRWKDPKVRNKVKEGIVFNLKYDRGGGNPANVLVISSSYDAAFSGLNLQEITAKLFDVTNIENAAETVIRLMESGRHTCIYHCLGEDDVRRIMQYTAGLIGSDSHTVTPKETLPHPRNFGTFPRVLGHYVRELRLLSLPQAIHKMTGAVAERLRLEQRGIIKEGYWADLVIFDPETIKDEATWTEPKKTAVGIHYVFVNGEMAMDNGQLTGKLSGRFLKRVR